MSSKKQSIKKDKQYPITLWDEIDFAPSVVEVIRKTIKEECCRAMCYMCQAHMKLIEREHEGVQKPWWHKHRNGSLWRCEAWSIREKVK